MPGREPTQWPSEWLPVDEWQRRHTIALGLPPADALPVPRRCLRLTGGRFDRAAVANAGRVAAEPLQVVRIVPRKVGDGRSLIPPEVEDAGTIRGSLRGATLAGRRGRGCATHSVVTLPKIGGPDLRIGVVQLRDRTNRARAVQIGVVQACQRPICRANYELMGIGSHLENFVDVTCHRAVVSPRSALVLLMPKVWQPRGPYPLAWTGPSVRHWSRG